MVKIEKKALEIGIGYRNLEEEMEKLIIFPAFSQYTRLTRFQKILMTLTLGLTDYAVYLRSLILKEKISPHEYAFAIDKFYDRGSDKYIHKRELPKEPETIEEWEKVYHILGARYNFEKKAVKFSRMQ